MPERIDSMIKLIRQVIHVSGPLAQRIDNGCAAGIRIIFEVRDTNRVAALRKSIQCIVLIGCRASAWICDGSRAAKAVCYPRYRPIRGYHPREIRARVSERRGRQSRELEAQGPSVAPWRNCHTMVQWIYYGSESQQGVIVK